MPPRLTPHRRKQIALQDAIAAEFTRIVYEELQWLLRAIRTKLKVMKVQQAQLQKLAWEEDKHRRDRKGEFASEGEKSSPQVKIRAKSRSMQLPETRIRSWANFQDSKGLLMTIFLQSTMPANLTTERLVWWP